MAAAQRSRLAMAFESKETARQRTEMAKNAKKRNPVGNLDTKVFDKEKLKEEVESYTDDVALNWSELARRHNVQNTNGEPAKNGGQIIKEWLKSEGVDVAKFKRKHDGNHEHIRRKKLRGQGGEITVATPQSIDSVKAELRGKIASGEYTVGQQIAPRKVTDKSINFNSTILTIKCYSFAAQIQVNYGSSHLKLS